MFRVFGIGKVRRKSRIFASGLGVWLGGFVV
jgi:hypothetical protein